VTHETVTTSQIEQIEPKRPQPGKSRVSLIAVLLVVVLAAAGVAWWATRGRTAAPVTSVAAAGSREQPGGFALRVEVMKPQKGGLGRNVVQPGVVHSFNKAELFAKVSGYLVRQRVDIGDSVKKGQLLAEIDIPELFKSADQARAALEQTKARVKQMEAHILTAQADRESASAQVQQAQADVARYTANRIYRKKELDRITALYNRQAVAAELVDEQQKDYDAAVASERASEAALATSRAALDAADARVTSAKADLDETRADVDAAQADLGKAEVLLQYTRIVSPYDGVITLRSFHDGDFIRSAAEGGTIPLLSVRQNDLMRVVILVPDLDVPYVKRGDPVTLQIDALPGRPFEGKVARFANAENEQKLMRTEVDLPNPDNLLRDGMYGTATIHLEPPSNHLRIPSAALIEQDGEGRGAVYVVRDGRAHYVRVLVDVDNGREVEVVKGLAPDDPVIVRYNGTLTEGLPVQAEPLRG
jgi:RND family efflux transporter MFP subunit